MSEENKSRLEGAIEQLRNHQTQLDADGIMVGVSREALDMALAALSAPKAEAEEPCPVCAKPFSAGDTCATDIELGKCHAECLAGSPTVDLETGEPVDGPIGTFPHVAPKAEAVTAERDHYKNGLQILVDTFYKGDQHQDYANHVLDTVPTSPVPALTDEAVERVARAWASIDGKLVEFEDERKSGCSLMEEDTGTYEGYVTEAAELLRRSGLLAAFPSKGEGE